MCTQPRKVPVCALNNRTLLAGHVKSWASSITPVGNGTPHNSVTLGSQVQTTNHMISNDIPAVAHDEDEQYFRDPLTISAKFTWYQKPVEAMVHTTNTSADAKSDLKAKNPISHAVQASLKHRHADCDNEKDLNGRVRGRVKSDGEEITFLTADDRGPFCDLHDVNVHMKVVKEPHVTTMTNIRIDKPVKKVKVSDRSQHGTKAMTQESRELALASSTSDWPLSIGTNSTTCRCIHFVNAKLPEELQEDRRWLKQMLPTLLMWARFFPDLWEIPDLELMTAL
ncbi:hypothetical protein F5J12DRAFT_781777 [Pisolithus orientalis]|uniref:uncharacterized protein n=1 Tax=Pisolithus orientalis TaxID=936130 RepID=UPI00222422E3|nr:uncharacterized protein F5J12DRAFT_781777 [Pisolithus orientalis]KAI6010790.1 hypothetical protein F5J12DRAFT_781777 [Pisolithus orientalis]